MKSQAYKHCVICATKKQSLVRWKEEDPEYVRNGTSSLIASINVSTEKINAYP